MKELLRITVTPLGAAFLEDFGGFLIGRFNSAAEAQKWCAENGYRSRIVTPESTQKQPTNGAKRQK